MAHVDLLHVKPVPQSYERSLSESLTFGFARGVDAQRLLSLACPQLAGSTFERGAFADDLFIAELVDGCFPLIVQGQKRRGSNEFFRCLLLSPPKDPHDTRFRQRICAELSKDLERREALERAYVDLQTFRDALCGSEHFSGRTLGVRRRLDVLSAFRTAVESLLKATGTARSGLQRIADWVEVVQKQQNYITLRHLLDFENSRAVLHTNIQTGYDGTLRRFEIVKVDLAEHDAFPRGAVSRFFRRLISLLKGYRFSEEDVMNSLLDQVFTDLEQEVVCLLRLLLQMEFYLRGLAFVDFAGKKGFPATLPSFVDAGLEAHDDDLISEQEVHGSEQERCEQAKISGLFNPWLAIDSRVDVVACDVEMGAGQPISILTGPNSGGKTRLLQSLAVVQLLGQVGLFIPAQSARLIWVDQLFLSLLEHAEPHQSEGRLGSELIRIRQVFESSGPRALVLMDELCSGTNPSEGERIFEMVLELLQNLGPQVWISTHFLDFAARIEAKRGATVRFLQVELNDSHCPTFQFVPGVAKTSLARNTAARLGVTREELMELIHRHQSSPDAR